MQAELLIRSGVIPRIIDDPDRARGALKLVAREDADAFLARLLAAARPVERPAPGMTDIVSAAGISRWPVVDIVRGILAGRFTRVECADTGLRFKGVPPVRFQASLPAYQAGFALGCRGPLSSQLLFQCWRNAVQPFPLQPPTSHPAQ